MSAIWEGIVEKKGSDFFGRWNRRKMALIGDECRYYEQDGVTVKGIIKLVDTTAITTSGPVIHINTIGRPDKKKEANGREFELRVADNESRAAFVAALQDVVTNLILGRTPSKRPGSEALSTPGASAAMTPASANSRQTPQKSASFFGMKGNEPGSRTSWASASLKNLMGGSPVNASSPRVNTNAMNTHNNNHGSPNNSTYGTPQSHIPHMTLPTPPPPPPPPPQSKSPAIPQTQSANAKSTYSGKPSSFVPPTSTTTTTSTANNKVTTVKKTSNLDPISEEKDAVGSPAGQPKPLKAPGPTTTTAAAATAKTPNISSNNNNSNPSINATPNTSKISPPVSEKSVQKSYSRPSFSSITSADDTDMANPKNNLHAVLAAEAVGKILNKTGSPSPESLKASKDRDPAPSSTSSSTNGNFPLYTLPKKNSKSNLNTGGTTTPPLVPNKPNLVVSTQSQEDDTKSITNISVASLSRASSVSGESVTSATSQSNKPRRPSPPSPVSSVAEMRRRLEKQSSGNSLPAGPVSSVTELKKKLEQNANAKELSNSRKHLVGTNIKPPQPVPGSPARSSFKKGSSEFVNGHTTGSTTSSVSGSDKSEDAGKIPSSGSRGKNYASGIASSSSQEGNGSGGFTDEDPNSSRLSSTPQTKRPPSTPAEAESKRHLANKLVEEALKPPAKSIRPPSHPSAQGTEPTPQPLSSSVSNVLKRPSETNGTPAVGPHMLKPLRTVDKSSSGDSQGRSLGAETGTSSNPRTVKFLEQESTSSNFDDATHGRTDSAGETSYDSIERFLESQGDGNRGDGGDGGGDRKDIKSVLEAIARSKIGLEPQLPAERVKLTHTKSHKRKSSSGAGRMYATMSDSSPHNVRAYDRATSMSLAPLTSSSGGASLAERKKLLASPFQPKRTSDDLGGMTIGSLAGRGLVHNNNEAKDTKAESLENRARKIEIEDLGPEDTDTPVALINDKNFLIIAKKFIEHNKVLRAFWTRKSERIVDQIEEIRMPATFEKRQWNVNAEVVSSYDDLFKAARAVRPFFNQAVKQAAYDAGITAVEHCSAPDCLVYLPPPSLMGDVAEKSSYFDDDSHPGPPESYIYDIVQGRVLCLSEQQISDFIRRVSVAPLVRIVELRNHFMKAPPSGYLDLVLILQVEYQEPTVTSTSHTLKTSKFFCQLQVTHVSVHKLSLRQSAGLRLPLMEYMKPYFNIINLADETIRSRRLEILKLFADINDLGEVIDEYNENKGKLFTLASTAIKSNNIEDMRAVRDLFAKLDISTGEAHMQRAIVQYAKEKYSAQDIKVAHELEVLAKLLVLDPDADIAEISALYLQCIDIKGALLGPKHVTVTKIMMNLALALEEVGDYTTAKTFAQGALKIRTAQLPPNDRLIGESLHVLGSILDRLGDPDEAIAIYTKAVNIRIAALSKEHPLVASTYTNLAIALDAKDQLNEAEDLLRDALEILRRAYGDENIQVAEAFLKLASTLYSQGLYEECKQVLEKSIEIRKLVSDGFDLSMAESYKLLSNVLRVMGKYNEAKPVADEALFLFHSIHGKNHPDTTAALYNVGVISDALGKYDEADDTFRLTLKHRRRLLGNDATEVAETLSSLSSVLKVKGQIDEAETAIQEALDIYRRKHGDEHPMVVECMLNLGNIHKMKDRLDDAKSLYDKTLDIAVKVHGRCHVAVAQLLNNIGVVLKQKGDIDGAKRMYEESLIIRKQVCGKDHPYVAESLNNLAVLHKELGRFREAKGFFEQALAIYKKVYNDEHEVVAAAYHNLAGLLHAQDPKSLNAMKYGKQAVEIATKVLGESHPTTKAYKAEWP